MSQWDQPYPPPEGPPRAEPSGPIGAAPTPETTAGSGTPVDQPHFFEDQTPTSPQPNQLTQSARRGVWSDPTTQHPDYLPADVPAPAARLGDWPPPTAALPTTGAWVAPQPPSRAVETPALTSDWAAPAPATRAADATPNQASSGWAPTGGTPPASESTTQPTTPNVPAAPPPATPSLWGSVVTGTNQGADQDWQSRSPGAPNLTSYGTATTPDAQGAPERADFTTAPTSVAQPPNTTTAPPASGSYAPAGTAAASYAPPAGYAEQPAYPTGYAQPGYGPTGYASQPGYQQPGYAPPYGYPQPYQQPVAYPGQPTYPAPAKQPGGGVGGAVFRMVALLVLVLFVLPTLLQYYQNSQTANPTTPTTSRTTYTPTPVPAGEYQHEDYQIPERGVYTESGPSPSRLAEAQEWAEQNTIYGLDLAVPIRCELTRIDPMSSSNSQLQTHFEDLVVCLLRTWGPLIEQAGFEATHTEIKVFDGSVQSACGMLESGNASYCSGDQTIYFSTEVLWLVPREHRDNSLLVDAIIAHEFAHAIQDRTGILQASSFMESRAEATSGADAANTVSRRAELQSDCWAGQSVQAITQSVSITADEQSAMAELFYSMGDDLLSQNPEMDGSHGYSYNRQSWFEAGLTGASVGTCNAFTAAEDQVR